MEGGGHSVCELWDVKCRKTTLKQGTQSACLGPYCLLSLYLTIYVNLPPHPFFLLSGRALILSPECVTTVRSLAAKNAVFLGGSFPCLRWISFLLVLGERCAITSERRLPHDVYPYPTSLRARTQSAGSRGI